ncbi:M48 family metallopeptidase [Acidaminococcus massiliensis]|uniref:M48 family metallopeptidase n=1 Tax=Acidaminococcus massiliensis TaxID=1852375 RepID=UPI0023F22A32|nr:M48 family metallopeptidase [Acidaminococcus massiliensis]
MRKLFGILVFCLLMVLPAPRSQAAMISQKQEIEMGQQVAQQLENHYGLVQDDEIQDRVSRIGQKLLANGTRPGLTYTFKVLNTPDVNALACPGGFIYVYKGLLDYMTSDDELAAVLGHEIGHIEKRHTVHQMEQQMALSLLTLLAGVASGDPRAGMVLASTASQALMAGYSRKDEREADQEGFRLSTLAGYNPYGSYVTMAKLEDMSKDMGNPGYGLFASHPEPEVRMAKALKWTEPLKIPEKVTVKPDGTAAVSLGAWSFPLTETAGYDKPEYRARLMAGALYLAWKRGNLDESHFMTVDGDRWSDVYYEDIRVLRVYPQDNQENGNTGELALKIAGRLQEWARIARQQPVPKVAPAVPAAPASGQKGTNHEKS